MTLKIISAYRTVSANAALILAESLQLDLLVEERNEKRIMDEYVSPTSVRKNALNNWQNKMAKVCDIGTVK